MVPGTQALPVIQWAEVSRTCVDFSTDFNIQSKNSPISALLPTVKFECLKPTPF